MPEPYESGWVDQVAGMPVVKAAVFFEGSTIDIGFSSRNPHFKTSCLPAEGGNQWTKCTCGWSVRKT